jgi:hypothetical protein
MGEQKEDDRTTQNSPEPLRLQPKYGANPTVMLATASFRWIYSTGKTCACSPCQPCRFTASSPNRNAQTFLLTERGGWEEKGKDPLLEFLSSVDACPTSAILRESKWRVMESPVPSHALSRQASNDFPAARMRGLARERQQRGIHQADVPLGQLQTTREKEHTAHPRLHHVELCTL